MTRLRVFTSLKVRSESMLRKRRFRRAWDTGRHAVRVQSIWPLAVANAYLDVFLFVGTLSAKSETLAIHHTTQEIARGVLNLGG